jgi:Flp pilus assembly pilin Flp
MNLLIPTYVVVTNFVADRVEAVKTRHKERGASMIEYGALLILIAAIVGAVMALNIHQTVGKKVQEAITNIFKGPGG